MKIIHEPKVYLIGKQLVVDEQVEEFLKDHDVSNWTTDAEVPAEKLCEISGRLCYMSFAKPRPGGVASYLKHILESQHGSVIEMAQWTFIYVNVSRALTHELIRSRTQSYAMLSQRYVDESVGEYVEPKIISEDPELHKIWLNGIKASHEAYIELSNKLYAKLLDKTNYIVTQEQKTAIRKEARQAARSVLANATETKIVVSSNARSLRHFLEIRGSKFAEVEIRSLANQVLDIMQVEAPNLFGDYKKSLLPDGTYEITTDYRKV